LEQAVISTLAAFGITGRRDPGATGVWVEVPPPHPTPAKIAAMGVRVRRWVSLHGLSLNVDPEMDHFQLIVPCGLVGRPVTSLRGVLGPASPPMPRVKATLVESMQRLVGDAMASRQRSQHLDDGPQGLPAV
jgi:lipoyl(octanoyl) transferase